MRKRKPGFEGDDFDTDVFEDEDPDLGEPVTEKLQVLLDALPEDDSWQDGDTDLGDPVTDKLHLLLGELPGGGALVDDDVDLGEPVTDKLSNLLKELPREGVWARAHRAAQRRQLASAAEPSALGRFALLSAELVKALFRPAGRGK